MVSGKNRNFISVCLLFFLSKNKSVTHNIEYKGQEQIEKLYILDAVFFQNLATFFSVYYSYSSF